MPKITFLHHERTTIEVDSGTNLLDAAKAAHAQVGYACGGVCACSTCHVYVKKGLASLSTMKEREEDILDKAFDVRSDSRLSCQAYVTNEDVEVEISKESRQAYFDEHPHERASKNEASSA